MPNYTVGDLIMVNGIRAQIVAFRKTVRGEFSKTQDRYIVFVEQTGDYRMGSIRTMAAAVTPYHEKG